MSRLRAVLILTLLFSGLASAQIRDTDIRVRCECPLRPERSGFYPPGTNCVRICVDSPPPPPPPAAERTVAERRQAMVERLDRAPADPPATADVSRAKAVIVTRLNREFIKIILGVSEDNAVTERFMREARDACRREGTPTTRCALDYTAVHKKDVPPDYLSRRNAEHYFLAKNVCEGPGSFFLTSTSPKRLVFDVVTAPPMLSLVALYSVLKDVDVAWGILFPGAGRYLGARAWVASVDEWWSTTKGVPLGTFRGYVTGTAFTGSPGTLKEGYWSIRGFIDCHP